MATSSPIVNGEKSEEKRNERQNQVMLGELPLDFLRVIPMNAEQQLATDMQTAMALQHQINTHGTATDAITGRLSVSIIEAKLIKNYGMTRMDPYLRLRIGHTIFETHTDANGAKTPYWNKVFHCFMYPKATSIYIEIFDECSFSLDEKIAWVHYELPESVLQGEVLEEWIPLNGRQGDGKEGFLHCILSYQPIPAGTLVYPPQPAVAVMQAPVYFTGVPYNPAVYPQGQAVPGQVMPGQVIPGQAMPGQVIPGQVMPGQVMPGQVMPGQVMPGQIMPGHVMPGQGMPAVSQTIPPQPIQITDADVQQVKEMFPDIEDEVVRSVMESENGNKDRTINALLTMSEGA